MDEPITQPPPPQLPPQQVVGEGSINLQGGKTYKLGELCLEPKTWQVRKRRQRLFCGAVAWFDRCG